MKTVFKKGMKVYDQLNFPDKEGKVMDICKDERVTSPITVIFKDKNDEEIERYYTSDGRYKIDKLPVLSTKPYQIILQGFEQKAPVPTFEEAWNNSHNSKEIFYSSNCDKVCSGYPTQELADASEALRRLLFLRDYYNEGWQANWNDTSLKHIIYMKVEGGWNFLIDSRSKYPRVLHFKSEEIAKKFIKEQKELLEIAKPLL